MRVSTAVGATCTALSLAVVANAGVASLTDTATYSANDIIRRDVVIVGGGSAGTYAAINLRDNKKSVVVIEPKDHLGGNAETYVDPKNGYTVDIGVIVFANIPIVTNYFARFNVPLIPLPTSASTKDQFVDFSTGRKIQYSPPGPEAVGRAFQAYRTQLARFPNIATSFNLSNPVEPDLLLPFGDFLKKYNLGDLAQTLFVTNQGYAPLLKISTLYMLKYCDIGEVNSLTNGFLTTKNHNIQELYKKAADELGASALLKSSVISMDRSDKSLVKVAVQTPSGRKLIIAKKMLSTAPPTLSTLKNYDLSKQEHALFSQFFANGYYTGILKNSGLPSGTSLRATGPGQPYNVPNLPGPYGIRYNPNINMTQIYYASPNILSSEKVKADIVNVIERYKRVNAIKSASYAQPEWAIFSAHAPFNLMVSNDAIKKGFYNKLADLQGQRNTYYAGAAFVAQDSSQIWPLVKDQVVPKMLGSLG